MLLTNQQRGWFFLFSFKTCGTTTPNCFYFAHANVVPWLTNSWINFRGLFWIEAFKWSSKSNGLCVENRLCQNGPLRNEKTICALYFRQWCALPKRYKWIQWLNTSFEFNQKDMSLHKFTSLEAIQLNNSLTLKQLKSKALLS